MSRGRNRVVRKSNLTYLNEHRWAELSNSSDQSKSPLMMKPRPSLAADSCQPMDADAGDGAAASAAVEVQRILDYEFRNPGLLEEALTHPSSSAPGRPSYQRLEFLGDSALCLALSSFFYTTSPGVGAGALSVLRSANLSTEKLARAAVRHGLYRLLRRSVPKLDQLVSEFTLTVTSEKEEDFDVLPYGGSIVKAPKVLADVVESIAGAVYVDCNFNLEMLWKVFRGILEPIITLTTLHEQPITMLHDLSRKQGKTVNFNNWKEDSTNVTHVFLDGKLLGVGSSPHKHIAKLNAARDALQKLYNDEPADMEF